MTLAQVLRGSRTCAATVGLPLARQVAAQRLVELLGIEGLGDEAVHPGSGRVLAVLLERVGRERDDRHRASVFPIERADLDRRLEAVEQRHLHVHQHEIERSRLRSVEHVHGFAPVRRTPRLDALLKGLIGAGYTFKTPGPASCCIFTVKDSDKPEFVDIAWKLKSMGYKLYGTSGTCAWLNKHMVPCNEVRNMSGEAPNIVDLLQSGLVD